MQESGRPSVALLPLKRDAGLHRFMAEKSVEHSGRPDQECQAVLRRKFAAIDPLTRLIQAGLVCIEG